MNDSFFNSIHISNFKSLKDVTLNDCKRINLLIGKPNVGKSNILEALGLLGIHQIEMDENQSLTQLIRLKNIPELFFDGEINNTIKIEFIDGYSSDNKYRGAEIICNKTARNLLSLNILIKGREAQEEPYRLFVDSTLNISWNSDAERLFEEACGDLYFTKHYKFSSHLENNQMLFAEENIYEAIQANKDIKKDILTLFSEYGQKIVFDKATQTLKILKETGGDIFLLPYSSIADTLQRIIFYKAAIASNKNSILLFEEPEAHCFPPYISSIVQDIIEANTNQFFIATHSPYVLNDLLEYKRDDVAIYMADFKDGQTKIKRLTDNELNDVYDYGLDLFFNSELFTDEI